MTEITALNDSSLTYNDFADIIISTQQAEIERLKNPESSNSSSRGYQDLKESVQNLIQVNGITFKRAIKKFIPANSIAFEIIETQQAELNDLKRRRINDLKIQRVLIREITKLEPFEQQVEAVERRNSPLLIEANRLIGQINQTRMSRDSLKSRVSRETVISSSKPLLTPPVVDIRTAPEDLERSNLLIWQIAQGHIRLPLLREREAFFSGLPMEVLSLKQELELTQKERDYWQAANSRATL